MVAIQGSYPLTSAGTVLRLVRGRRPVGGQDHVAVRPAALGAAELTRLVVVVADLATDRGEPQHLVGRLSLAVARRLRATRVRRPGVVEHRQDERHLPGDVDELDGPGPLRAGD